MDQYVIEGGHPLRGSVRISGAKNSALILLAACILTPAPLILHGVPRLIDTEVLMAILRRMGVQIKEETSVYGRTLVVDASGLNTPIVPDDLMRRMRASIVLLGPLLGRLREAVVSYPGGCDIGPRPINLHLKGFRQLNVVFEEGGGIIHARGGRLRGGHIYLDQPSVGATENLMLGAVLAEGRTTIRNPAREPEIVDLANFLNAMGARVFGAGSDFIEIEGVRRLGSAEHVVMPDRIEAGTYLLAGACTGGEVTVTHTVPGHLDALLAKLMEAGAEVLTDDDRITVRMRRRPLAVDVKTQPYPGFPTDLQNPMMVLMLCAEGTSVVTETIFDNRFKVVEEFRRMGAQIQTDGHVAVVRGVPQLTGAEVRAMQDLRGGAALVLAALTAQGTSIVNGTQHILRGYEDLEAKLTGLGARIGRDCLPVNT